MKFLGIDFGWSSGESGLCCLEWQEETLEVLEICRHFAIEDILAWVDRHTSLSEPALVAVDAPTLIPNATGMRMADKLTHKYFGKYHAGCYPANLNSRFAQRTIALGLALEARGFVHADVINPQQLGRYQIEVFPHPAMIHLFSLDRILKYKKGRLAERRLELIKLQTYIQEILPNLEPALTFKKQHQFQELFGDLSRLNGSQFKAIEDQLDAVMCAYIGAYWWYWGLARNLVLGDSTTGYIVIPKALT
jgi:predicted RNase H-like nuclease